MTRDNGNIPRFLVELIPSSRTFGYEFLYGDAGRNAAEYTPRVAHIKFERILEIIRRSYYG